MRLLNPALHRVLDFVTVAAFAIAPKLLGLTGLPSTLAYLLAVVHLLLTLATKFTSTGRGFVPLQLHGIVELIVGIALLIAPLALGWLGTARVFYVSAGVVILVVWMLTDYNDRAAYKSA